MRAARLAFALSLLASSAMAQATLPVARNADGSVVRITPTASVDTYATGSIAANTLGAAYIVPLGLGQATVSMSVTGLTASGATLVSEYSDDNGATWATIRTIGTAVAAGVATLASDGQVTINGSGHTRLRLRVSVVGTGTVNITANASTAVKEITLGGQQPPPLAVTTTSSAFTGSATANAYTAALTANTSRRNCFIYSASAFTVALGPTAANGIPQTAGTVWSCASAAGTMTAEQVSVSSATASASYIVWSQQ